MESCGACQKALVSRREAEALFVKPGDLGRAGDLWKRIERSPGRQVPVPEKAARLLTWEWAAGAALVLLLAAASFWLLRDVQTAAVRADFARPAERFEINYIKVGGAPAQAYIFQPKGADMIIVWAGKAP
jgi:hypothetical protein